MTQRGVLRELLALFLDSHQIEDPGRVGRLCSVDPFQDPDLVRVEEQPELAEPEQAARVTRFDAARRGRRNGRPGLLLKFRELQLFLDFAWIGVTCAASDPFQDPDLVRVEEQPELAELEQAARVTRFDDLDERRRPLMDVA